jgi:hypothetical protein
LSATSEKNIIEPFNPAKRPIKSYQGKSPNRNTKRMTQHDWISSMAPRIIKKWIIAMLSVILTGCASHNISIPDMTIRSAGNVKIKAISIVDRTSGESRLKISWGWEDQQFPLKQNTPFVIIAGDDLSAFFAKSNTSEYSLNVIIQTAEPYWTLTVPQRIPVIGWFASGMDVEYGVYLRLQIEVEQNNKVVRTYLYDQVIKTMGKNGTGKDVEESYQKLITVYRQEFFSQLESEFVSRYF